MSRTSSTAIPFTVPALSPLAAVRSRQEEIAEREQEEHARGYRDGYEAGMQAARAEVDRLTDEHREAMNRLSHAAAAVAAAAADLQRRDAVTIDEFEHDAIAIAIELATDMIGRELELTEQPVLDAIRRAAGLVPDRGTPVIRVHPDDADTVRGTLGADVTPFGSETSLVPDPSIEPGGCVVDVGPCRIDAQLGPALARLRAALR